MGGVAFVIKAPPTADSWGHLMCSWISCCWRH